MKLVPGISRLVTAALIISCTSWSFAKAEQIRIVAFGDSGVYGSGRSSSTGISGGVSLSDAFPAQIERKLRARGWDVTVSNQGVPGDTAARAISRVNSAVPAGTTLTFVFLGGNDMRQGTSPNQVVSYLRTIAGAIKAKGSEVLVIWSGPGGGNGVVHWSTGLWKNSFPVPQYDSGDKEHLNVAGNAVFASRAIPDIENVLKKKGFKPSK